MPNDSQRPDVAVFIDFENVYVSVRDKLDANPNFESIMDRCEDFGRVVIARAYADWYRYPRVTSALYANAIEPMYVPTYYYDREMGRTGRPIKNSVDMNLCVDAMKTLFTNPNIAKFVLATGDRDFIPLVNTIRQQGKEVIIIGIGGAASSHLAQSADEFIFYESLVGKHVGPMIDDVPRARMPEKGRDYDGGDEAAQPRRTERGDRSERTERSERSERVEAPNTNGSVPTTPLTPAISNGNGTSNGTTTPNGTSNGNTSPDIFDTLVKAINLARERGYVCSFGSLKLLMKELMGGDFKESRYKDNQGRPFAKFKDFVMEAERRGKVQVFTNGTVNEVFLPGEDPYKLSQFAQELKVDPDQSPVAPIETSDEARSESRSLSPTGRRRRRRRPGRQANGQASEMNGLDDIEAFDDIDTESLTAPELPDLPDLIDTNDADEVFEELLERIEAEDQQTAPVIDLDVEAILEPETSEIEDTEPVTDSAPELPTLTTRPFDDAERELLREIASEIGKPVSFAQIHDALRGARNRLSVPRTNEELRSLVKLGINSGMLVRQGKGNRISYRLADPQPETETGESVDQMSQIAEAQAEAFEQPHEVEVIQTDETLHSETGSPVLDGLYEAAELASDPVAAEQQVEEIVAEATAIALEPASDISGVAALEPEVVAPKRRRRKATAEPAAEAAPAETAPTEATEAAPKRRRRKATAEPTAEAAPTEATEDTPKRRTRRRKTEEAGE